MERLSFGRNHYFARQAEQVFYVDDLRNSKWNIVIYIFPRDMYNMLIAVVDDDRTSQYPSSSKADDVGDFDDLVIDN